MRLLEFADATTFLNRSRSFLLSSEAENNLLLSSALALAKASAARSPRLSFFAVESQGRTICAALNSSERRLLLSFASADAASFMGGSMAVNQIKIKGALGPTAAVSSFCRSFASASQDAGDFTLRFSQKILRLESLQPVRPSSGLARVGTEKDLRLLMNWAHQFVEECAMDESPQETEEMVRRYVDNRQLFIWDDGRSVAMCGYGGITPNGVRVNMVYTDPNARGKGYAGSLVHLLSRKLLASGHKFCFLFTDSTNPASNRIYQSLGYRPVIDFAEFRLASGSRGGSASGSKVSTTG